LSRLYQVEHTNRQRQPYTHCVAGYTVRHWCYHRGGRLTLQMRSGPRTRSTDFRCHRTLPSTKVAVLSMRPLSFLFWTNRTTNKSTAIEPLLRSRSLRRARAVLGYHNDTYDHQIERHPVPRQHGIRDVDASQVRERPWYSQVLVRLILGKSRIRSRECQEGDPPVVLHVSSKSTKTID
jgi:hypothetical protein